MTAGARALRSRYSVEAYPAAGWPLRAVHGAGSVPPRIFGGQDGLETPGPPIATRPRNIGGAEGAVARWRGPGSYPQRLWNVRQMQGPGSTNVALTHGRTYATAIRLAIPLKNVATPGLIPCEAPQQAQCAAGSTNQN